MNVSTPTKEKLLSSISPQMQLTVDFFKKVYGYELSYPGFAEQAIATLEAADCSNARKYYNDWTGVYEKEQHAVLKPVSEWYRLQCEKRWNDRVKGGGEIWTQQQDLQQMSNRDLITLLENLIGAT